MKKNKLSFNKSFFATVIDVSERRLNYTIIVTALKSDNQELSFRAGIKVTGINHWVWDIETARFIPIGGDTGTMRPRVYHTKSHVTFSHGDVRVDVRLTDFYRTYMTRVANNLLE